MKNKLEQLNQAFHSLKTKIKSKLEKDEKFITETQTQLQASDHKLELSLKEQKENEKVLEQLVKEFKELGEELYK